MLPGSPASILLVTRKKSLPEGVWWDFGIWSDLIYAASVAYAILVVMVALVSPFCISVDPIKTNNSTDSAGAPCNSFDYEPYGLDYGMFYDHDGSGMDL